MFQNHVSYACTVPIILYHHVQDFDNCTLSTWYKERHLPVDKVNCLISVLQVKISSRFTVSGKHYFFIVLFLGHFSKTERLTARQQVPYHALRTNLFGEQT